MKKKKPDQEKSETDVVEETSVDPVVSETEDQPDATDPVAEDAAPKDGEPGPEDAEPEVETTETAEPPAEVEETPETDDLPEQAPQTEVVERVVETRGGFGAALLGGAVAAVLGFVAGRADLIDPLLPPSWRSVDSSEAIAALQSDLSAQSNSIDALGEKVDGLAIPDINPVTAALDDLTKRTDPIEAQINALGEQADAFDARLTGVEKRPMSQGVSEEAIAAYERELARLQETVATQRAEVEALIENARAKEMNATEAARVAAAQTAVARLRAALDDGVPFAVAAQDLASLGVEMPDPLSSLASEGVPTLAALQLTFPPAARTALATVRDVENGGDTGLGAFLRRQLGARSVAPREGDDPDAVLSRAQAAVTDGQLAIALNEISTLPESARAAMSDWTGPAQKRLDAVTAAESLAQSLIPN
ncbi:COG4223 family protein [Arenibacterium sp. CAU 1754]